ncbi:MAG: hypothetical protein F6K47_33895, partial [Symploca sp. SIO2E6]|nr:hypothetical protein [Symploca sp. SIO2E6]
FDDSRTTTAQTAGTTPKPNITISRVPTPFPLNNSTSNNHLINNWINEGFISSGTIDKKAIKLHLDPQPRALTAGETAGVYIMGEADNIDSSLLTVQTPYPTTDPDAFVQPIEKYCQPLFEPYWQAQYKQQYNAMFSTLVAFKDQNDKDFVLHLEVSLERKKPHSKTGTSTATYNSVSATLQRSAEPLMIFDVGTSTSTSLIRLVSLKQWKFRCEAQQRDFLGLFDGLNRINLSASYQPAIAPNLRQSYDKNGSTPLAQAAYREPQGSKTHTPPDDHPEALADSYIVAGYVPTPHYLRQGGRSISWYRGPLVPHKEALFLKQYKIALPVRHADELLIFNPELGLFDASYAAAWELGRLLTLANQSIATRLYQWKRAHPSNLREVSHSIDRAYLPVRDGAGAQKALPTEVEQWLVSLSQLKVVPFNYLIPDEALLPPESIRYFVVDPLWLECLRDGAISIGRVLSIDHRTDSAHHRQLPALPKISGVLVRSAVVSGWPHLGVTGYPEVDLESFQGAKLQEAFNQKLEKEKLARETLSKVDQEKFTSFTSSLDATCLANLREQFDKPWPCRTSDLAATCLTSVETALNTELTANQYSSAASVPTDYWEGEEYLCEPLKIWRMDRLAPDLLLVLFYDPVKKQDGTYCNRPLSYVDFHPRPEMMHFGLEEPTTAIAGQVVTNAQLVKLLRTFDGEPLYSSGKNRVQVSDSRMWRDNQPSKGILSLVHLSQIIAHQVLGSKRGARQDTPFTAANFALQMLDSPPLVRFKCPG